MNKKYIMSKRRRITKQEERPLSLALEASENTWFEKRAALLECLGDPVLVEQLLRKLEEQRKEQLKKRKITTSSSS